MHSLTPSSFLSLLLAATVSGSPVNSNALQAIFCTANKAAVTAILKDADATPYCSSYLSIPTITISTTVTETPSSVYTTSPVTITTTPVYSTQTDIESTTTDVTSTITEVKTAYSTTTLTTSTSTLTCLNSAYTYAPPVGVVPDPAKPALEEPTPELIAENKRAATPRKPSAMPTTWDSASVSAACSCLSIPTPSTTQTATQTLEPGTITLYTTNIATPTITAFETSTDISTNIIPSTTTTTTTLTVTAYAVETTIAANGISYRKYNHFFNALVTNNGFGSAFFRAQDPRLVGTLRGDAPLFSFATPNWPSGSTYLTLRDGASFSSDYTALVLQGFFVAKESGSYTFSASADYTDNWGYLWVGDVALSDWNDSNTAFKSERVASGPYTGGQYSVTMKAGDAVPVTYLWGNGGGVGRSFVQVQAPSGLVINEGNQLVTACSDSVFP